MRCFGPRVSPHSDAKIARSQTAPTAVPSATGEAIGVNLLVIHEVNYIAKIIYEFQILPELLSMIGHTVTVIDYDDSWKTSRNGARFRLGTTIYRDIHRAYPEASVTIRRPGMIRLPVLS